MIEVAFVQHYEHDIYLNSNWLAWKKRKIKFLNFNRRHILPNK